MADITKLHPATTVTNIKTCIPVILDYDGSQYNNWATLFKLHCRANLVIDHIIPPKDVPETTTLSATEEAAAKALWARLDDIVRQWIYGTISNDLLNTIIDQDDTAAIAWSRLVNLFQGNRSARALALDAKFTTTKLVDFPNVKAYCTRLKVLADSLANVGQKVSDERLVLRLLRGLSDEYKHFRTTVQQKDPLPSFEKVRSLLDLEEDNNGDEFANDAGSNTALFSHHPSTNSSSLNGQPTSSDHTNHNRGNSHHKGKKNHNRGRGGGGNRNHRGGATGGGNRNHNNQQQQARSLQPQPAPQSWFFPPWAHWGMQPWATPPCPYPTNGWQPTAVSNQQAQQAGILGARPPQMYYTATQPSPHAGGYIPTDVDQAMHTLSMQPPDENWYMDTGATSHMTSSQGFADGDQPNEM
ncbi:uncharacterized protein [Spinacia oleracea]|uniref:Retrotransposon Copia-like N-terminal domain-containing protein n=1 Tax=Spinacia oleracea TaxID=3562 RepID=A0A9R0IQR8_SPIOL|nr:uncharacterized protein LOC110789576 [Spinacia oleracea]